MEGDATEIQKQIEDRIAELPADIQSVILSSDFNEKIMAIGSSSALHIDQVQQLGDATMLVMLGFMNEDEYRKEVTDLVRGNSATAQKIISEVNEKIFLTIRESMKKFASGSETSPAPVPKPPTPAPAQIPPPTTEIHPADVMLTQRTVSTPGSTLSQTPAPQTNTTPPAQKPLPPKPGDYKADPYREPVN